jgi:hypothetical protein
MVKGFLRIIGIAVIVLLPVSMAHSQISLKEWLQKIKPRGKPPVVTHSFASGKVSHGDVWRIYLKADDPDGDIRQVFYSVGQGRAGVRFRSLAIKNVHRAGLMGYVGVVVSPPTTGVAEWTELILTLYIEDDRGNKSDEVAFSMALTRGVKQGSPPSPFDGGDLESLGMIWVELYRPLGDL